MIGVLALVACSKSGSSNKTNVNVNGGYNYNQCPGCANSQQQMFTVPAATISSGLTAQFQFLGNLQSMNQANSLALQNGGCAVHQYVGEVIARGTLTIHQDFYAGSCFVPRGQYSLNTTQVGSYNQGQFYIPNLEVVGNTQYGQVRMQVKLGSGSYSNNMVVIDNGHDCSVNNIAGPLVFLSKLTQYGSEACVDYTGSYLQ